MTRKTQEQTDARNLQRHFGCSYMDGLNLIRQHGLEKATDILEERAKLKEGVCSLCGRTALLHYGKCANASICKTGKDGPDHYP